MKRLLLRTLLYGAAMMCSQQSMAGTYYFYNKCAQFEVVPSAAATVYATTKADMKHTENMTSDVYEGTPVLFYYNVSAGYDDLYFTQDSNADGFHFVGYKVINKVQNEDGSDNTPTAEEIEAAELKTQIPVLNANYEETGEFVSPEALSVSKINIASKTTEATPDAPDTQHDGVLNGLYAGTAFASDGGTVGWHDYPDAYVYLYYSDEPLANGIGSVAADRSFRYVYDLNGLRTDEAHRGISIVKMSDGKTKKILK